MLSCLIFKHDKDNTGLKAGVHRLESLCYKVGPVDSNQIRRDNSDKFTKEGLYNVICNSKGICSAIPVNFRVLHPNRNGDHHRNRCRLLGRRGSKRSGHGDRSCHQPAPFDAHHRSGSLYTELPSRRRLQHQRGSHGFKVATLGPFRLDVNQTVRQDVRLEVGQVTEEVEVARPPPSCRPKTPRRETSSPNQQATELPLNGRNFVSLTLLVPGSINPNPSTIQTAQRNTTGGRPYVNGNREQSNNFLLDGIDINEPVGDLIGYTPNVDAVAEIQVLTGNANAEFGNGNGAVVNMTTKSGTNQFRGNIFEFLQNDKLNANSFFNNRSGAKKQALRQNVFGGTLGGPIKKDRLFFFIDYQGTRIANNGPSTAAVVPASMRAGDLSEYAQVIRDPISGNPFPNNLIPVSRYGPVATALFANSKLYPLPNASGSGPIGVVGNFAGVLASATQNDQADAKIDYRLGDRDSIFGRFTIDRYFSSPSAEPLPITIAQATNAPTTGAVINWTHTLSPTTVNEARIGYTRVKILTSTIDPDGVLGKNGDQLLGIPGSQPIAGASSILLGGDFTNIGSAASDRNTTDNDFHYSDNLTKLVGRHALKMGFNFLRYRENNYYAGNNGLLGIFTYDGTYTGNGFADFLLDQLHTKGRGSQTGLWGHRQWRDGIFFQDDFKVRRNLTLNLGLRWEYTQPLYEIANRQTNLNLQTGQEELAGQNGNSRALYNAYYKQFMPRVGFAFTPARLNNKFVVRGGYGITSFLEGTGANLRLPLNPPFYFESNITYDKSAPGHITSGFTDVNPLNFLSGQVRYWNPDLRPAFIQQWNLTTQYLFTQDFSVTAAYIGQYGTHLVNAREYNQPLPGTGPVTSWLPLAQRYPLFQAAPLITNVSGTDSSSIMRYNSLQMTANKRLSHGLQFVGAYTYSKTLADSLGYYGSGGVAAEAAYWQNAYNRHADYGPAFFDATAHLQLQHHLRHSDGQGPQVRRRYEQGGRPHRGRLEAGFDRQPALRFPDHDSVGGSNQSVGACAVRRGPTSICR